jgi:hypothetical protein
MTARVQLQKKKEKKTKESLVFTFNALSTKTTIWPYTATRKVIQNLTPLADWLFLIR